LWSETRDSFADRHGDRQQCGCCWSAGARRTARPATACCSPSVR